MFLFFGGSLLIIATQLRDPRRKTHTTTTIENGARDEPQVLNFLFYTY